MKYFILFFLLVIGCQRPDKTEISSLFWGFAVEGYPITLKQIENLEKTTNIKPQVILFFLDWSNSQRPYESLQPTLEAISNQKILPCLTWEPKINQEAVNHEDILRGLYDSYIDSVANDIKAWGKPLILRFAHEMNLSIYHWGTDLKEYGERSPEIYVKMYRYVVDIFNKKMVNNVHWAFCPNAESVPNESWNVPENYYPGDAYIDILGMDGYNWDINASQANEKKNRWVSPYRSFEQIFEPLYRDLKKISSQKPIVVFETATVERSPLHSKIKWLDEGILIAKRWKLSGIIWFQVDKEEDWTLGPLEHHYEFVEPPFGLK